MGIVTDKVVQPKLHLHLQFQKMILAFKNIVQFKN